ncbi:MAG: sugar phosphate isomerase/epimerase [Acidobacteria bacterium]|nr:sugar phosphate isomerase/epimerase [Acidobacteriota bacterium]MCI0722773.1 sugar phosphate isomerase/epimerase [Acidobacteriota bacterium]
MRFGINTFLFTSPFTNESTKHFKDFKAWGFQSVEIPLEHESHIDPGFVKSELAKHSLVCCAIGCAVGPGRDLRGTREEQNACLEYIHHTIDIAVMLECPTLLGPIYSSVGRAEFVPEKERKAQWKLVAGHLKRICRYAEKKRRKIALEPLNRFETDFMKTCAQGLRMIEDVGSPALSLLLDTFHMNIEEKDPARAIRQAGKKLGHFHACGCDRGTPGSDHIDWDRISVALRRIGYKGDVVIESFTPDVKVIAKAASIWRTIEPNKNDIAMEGVKFLKRILK